MGVRDVCGREDAGEPKLKTIGSAVEEDVPTTFAK